MHVQFIKTGGLYTVDSFWRDDSQLSTHAWSHPTATSTHTAHALKTHSVHINRDSERHKRLSTGSIAEKAAGPHTVTTRPATHDSRERAVPQCHWGRPVRSGSQKKEHSSTESSKFFLVSSRVFSGFKCIPKAGGETLTVVQEHVVFLPDFLNHPIVYV